MWTKIMRTSIFNSKWTQYFFKSTYITKILIDIASLALIEKIIISLYFVSGGGQNAD